MIVDSSALVAIALGESDADDLVVRLRSEPRVRMSAATYVETSIVIDTRSDPLPARRLDELLRAVGVEVVAFTESQARLARQAYRDFGKGSGHRAQLNFGDCFSYALAVEADEPLLYKGDDFVHTDVRPALPPPSD